MLSYGRLQNNVVFVVAGTTTDLECLLKRCPILEGAVFMRSCLTVSTIVNFFF